MLRLWMLMGFAGLCPADETPRVMTWNIHHGEGGDGRLDLERIAERIRKEAPAVVALQEVDRGCRRSGGVDQAEALARLTGMTARFGKAMDYQGGEYGLAVLTTLPMIGERVHRLPGEGEPRIAFEVVLEWGGAEVRVVNLHLDHRSAEVRRTQAERVRERFAADDRVILAGDFNAEPGSPTMRVFRADWSDASIDAAAPTIPAREPRRRIDYLLLRGFTAEEAWVPDEVAASDHRPVVAVIREAAEDARER